MISKAQNYKFYHTASPTALEISLDQTLLPYGRAYSAIWNIDPEIISAVGAIVW
jgi:hypothetical protein